MMITSILSFASRSVCAVCFFLQLFVSIGEADQGKIVYLISTPRSCSTVCLRMMEASGEFIVMNEPAIYPFITKSKDDHDLTQGWFHHSSFQTFEEMKKHILRISEDSNVFVKEISFFVEDFLLKDDEFVANPDVQFVFLIRNPHDLIISYYKKFQKIIPNFSSYVGSRASYSIYREIRKKAKNPIVILSAEDLCDRPEKTARMLFSSLSIPFHNKCLCWEDLGDRFSGIDEWSEVKVHERLYQWHDRAIHSTHFEPITKNRIDAEGKPTFEEIEDESDRIECMKMYRENEPFYRYLFEKKRAE